MVDIVKKVSFILNKEMSILSEVDKPGSDID